MLARDRAEQTGEAFSCLLQSLSRLHRARHRPSCGHTTVISAPYFGPIWQNAFRITLLSVLYGQLHTGCFFGLPFFFLSLYQLATFMTTSMSHLPNSVQTNTSYRRHGKNTKQVFFGRGTMRLKVQFHAWLKAGYNCCY